MLLKNTSGQGVYLYSYDTINGVPKTGDAANTTGSYALDGTNTNGFATANPTEMGGGVYWQPLAQAETNANAIAYRWASSTAGIQISPVLVLTTGVSLPVAAPGAANGLFVAGTNAATVITTSLTTHFVGTIDTVTTYTGNTPQTGDAFARIGATGSGLTSLASSSTALSTTQWTNARAGYLDNLSAGAVALASTALSTSTVIASSNTANTLGDCLNAARAQGFGKWAISGTTLTLYAPDGATSVRTFTLDSATAPTSRT